MHPSHWYILVNNSEVSQAVCIYLCLVQEIEMNRDFAGSFPVGRSMPSIYCILPFRHFHAIVFCQMGASSPACFYAIESTSVRTHSGWCSVWSESRGTKLRSICVPIGAERIAVFSVMSTDKETPPTCEKKATPTRARRRTYNHFHRGGGGAISVCFAPNS